MRLAIGADDLDARGRSPMCHQRTRPSLGGEAGGRSPGFISASSSPQANLWWLRSAVSPDAFCNRSTLAKISGLSMLSSMSAVALRPSGKVTVISPSLTSNRPDTGSPVMS